MSTGPIEHLYVHIPFCAAKCAYCAFYSIPHTAAREQAWVAAVRNELRRPLPGGRRLVPKTIYLGGGTPSVLSVDTLSALLTALRDACDPGGIEEWTIEANPDSVTTAWLNLAREHGVNRLSLGVQCLHTPGLRRVDRPHTAAEIPPAVARARRAGVTNIGADLIACLPGMTPRRWRETLEGVTRLGVSHVSVYALSIEPGTRLHRQHRNGRFRAATSEEEIAALRAAIGCLSTAGFERYEISNFAQPGFACRHNTACWQGRDYIGFGPAASSRVGRERWTNAPDLDAYVAALHRHRPPPCRRDTLTPRDNAIERFIFALRLCRGVDLGTVSAPRGVMEHWSRTLKRLETLGLTAHNGTRWRLTDRGLFVADSVARDLLPEPDSGKKCRKT